MRGISVEIGGVVARGRFLDELAPRTCEAIRAVLPIHDRGIHVHWSGSAWRTERNYPLPVRDIENRGGILEPGDLAYYPRLDKIIVCYQYANWRGPEIGPDGKPYIALRDISVFARLEGDLKAFAEVSHDLLVRGMQPITISAAS
jgi:hypothetical protein